MMLQRAACRVLVRGCCRPFCSGPECEDEMLFESQRSWVFKALTSFCAVDATVTAVALPNLASHAASLSGQEQLMLGLCYSIFAAVPVGLLGVISHYQGRYVSRLTIVKDAAEADESDAGSIVQTPPFVVVEHPYFFKSREVSFLLQEIVDLEFSDFTTMYVHTQGGDAKEFFIDDAPASLEFRHKLTSKLAHA